MGEGDKILRFVILDIGERGVDGSESSANSSGDRDIVGEIGEGDGFVTTRWDGGVGRSHIIRGLGRGLGFGLELGVNVDGQGDPSTAGGTGKGRED